MEQLNIMGWRSGKGYVFHKEGLVSALAKAQADKVGIIDTTLGRKGFLNYLKALGGSNIIKIVPSNGVASESQHVEKGLKVVCGSNTSHLEDGAWVTEKIRVSPHCEVRVSSQNGIRPNLGALELAEALSRVIPFAARDDSRPVLACVRFIRKDGKLNMTTADGFTLADLSLDFEDGEGEALVAVKELKGLVSALKKAKRGRLSFEEKISAEGEPISKILVIETEAIRYQWESLDGNYPDTEKLIPAEFAGEARFDTREMLAACQSLAALSLDKGTPIKLTMAEGKVILDARDEKGQTEIQAEVCGEMSAWINSGYLMQTLKALDGMAELKLKSPSEAMLFSVDGYRVVVMPVYVPESKAIAEAEAIAQEAETAATEGQQAEEQANEVKATDEKKPKPKQKHKVKEPVA